MSILKLEEIIGSKHYSISSGQENILQLRKLEIRLYDFLAFKINENVPEETRKSAGNLLYEYCKENSIVISTDNMDYDIPIVSFLEESGFNIKYIKIIYEKDLRQHQYQYEDIFGYISLEETGLKHFMRVFEKTADVGIEKDVSPYEYFNVIIDYAGDKYNPANYQVVIHNGKEIGVIMPQVYPDNNKEGTIIHMGVVPEERNKGYGKIMHSKSLEILKNQGVEKYIGSTNANNKSMIRLFEINGCSEWFKRKFYCTG